MATEHQRQGGAGSAGVRRAALEAARDRAHTAGGESKAWNAWQRGVIEAESAFKVALGEALHEMEEAFALANHWWEKALADARHASDQIEDPAREYLKRQVEAARQARDSILGPAAETYDAAITAAHEHFTKVVALAERAYRTELDEATRTKMLTEGMTRVS